MEIVVRVGEDNYGDYMVIANYAQAQLFNWTVRRVVFLFGWMYSIDRSWTKKIHLTGNVDASTNNYFKKSATTTSRQTGSKWLGLFA